MFKREITLFKKTVLSFTTVLLALCFAGAAQASLLGQTVTCSVESRFDHSCASPTATVTDGGTPEFEVQSFFGSALFAIDVSGDSVLMTAVNLISTGGPNLVTLGDLIWANDPGATITGIANVLVSGVTEQIPGVGDGLVASDVSFAANSVTIDYSRTDWDLGDFISFDLVTTHSALPEPATLALFGLGLMGLGFAARRRRI